MFDFRYHKVMPADALGYRVWIGATRGMRAPHTHNDLELNFILAGSVTYLWQGGVVTLPPGKLAAFWGACAHQVIDFDPDVRLAWVTIPMQDVAHLPGIERLVSHWLGGAMVRQRSADPLDPARFTQWAADHEAGDAAPIAAGRMEVEARLMRLAAQPITLAHATSDSAHVDGPLQPAVAMAAYIAEHFDEPIQAADVARHAGLHANYAMAIFKKRIGVTINQYLTRQRLCNAQRLLVMTDTPVLEVGLASGFGSTSRFYEAFKRQLGVSPAVYRQRRDDWRIRST